MKSHLSLPIIEVSSLKDVIKFFNGLTSPVIMYADKRSFLVSDFSIALTPKKGELKNLSKKINRGDVFGNANEFVNEKMFWTLRFNGENIGPLEQKRGMLYIHRLLSNPNQEYTYNELRGVIAGTKDESSINPSHFAEGSESRVGRIVTSIGGSIEIGDKKMRESICKNIRTLNEHKSNAEEEISRLSDDLNPDVRKIKKLEKTIDEKKKKIKELEKDAITYSFGRKILDKNEKNLRNQIQTAIDRSVKMIAQYNIELAKHLKNNIKRTNGKVEYRPPGESVWITTK